MKNAFDIVVIGAGPGGYIAALKAAKLGANTAVIEKHHLGGTCLNYGCIPSKALLASAERLHQIQDAASLGVHIDGKVSFDWTTIQNRKDKVVAKLRRGVQGLFGTHKITLFQGSAQFTSPTHLIVTNADGTSETITGKKIIIATGSIPAQIPGWPTDPKRICTSDEALHWSSLPKQLLIIGGGVIGVEFACMMHEYGVQVTIVEMQAQLLPEMDVSLGPALAQVFSKRGIQIKTGVKIDNVNLQASTIKATLSNGKTLEADKILVATGRRPNTTGLGLDTVGLETKRGFIPVDNRMTTAVDNIYCIGDANGQCLLAHAASAQGITAVQNALDKDHAFALPIPSAVYTFPEVAAVGLTTQQAAEQQIPVRIGQYPIEHLGKAMAVGHETGFVRVIRHRQDKSLLGVHMLGHNATEIIESATALISTQASTEDLANMVFAHPTLGEAVKEAAEDSFGQALHLPPKKVVKMVAETVDA